MSIKGLNFQLSATNNAQNAFNSFNRSLAGIQQGLGAQRPLMRSWNAGLNSNRRAVQQLGFQMSDFAIQVAGGQSAMLAFVQQGGQILQFFGPFGAVMAALLAIFGSLYIAMTKTGTAIDQLYPFLGVLANEFKGIVDSIGSVIDIAKQMGIWVVYNLDQIIITAAVAIGYFGTMWVASMITAAAATWTFAGALEVVRVALIRTGLGAIIILVGYLIERFLTLSRGVGGFGNAIKLVWDVAKAVFYGIGDLAYGMGLSFVTLANKFAAVMLRAINSVIGSFMEMTWQIADGLNTLFNTDIFKGAAIGEYTQELARQASDFEDSAVKAANGAVTAFSNAGSGIKKSWGALMAALANGETPTPVLPPSKTALGTGSGKAVTDQADEIKKIFDDMQKSISDSLMGGFKALMTRSKSFADAAKDILGSVADKVFNILAAPLFNNIAGGLAGGIMKGMGMPSFEGGGFTGSGSRSGGLDGKGGRIAVLHPNETVLDHTKGQGVSGGNVTVYMTVNTPDVEGFRKSRTQIQAEIARAGRAGMRGN